MLNKKLEKIVINSAEEAKLFKGKNLKDKHLIVNKALNLMRFNSVEGCVIEGCPIVCNKISNCQLNNVKCVYAYDVENSVFKHCEKIQLGDIDEGHKITESKFFHCNTIMINDATVDSCVFNDFETLYLTKNMLCNCTISDIVCNNRLDCAISIEDCEMTNVLFENIKLYNNSYLIVGYGICVVENSAFTNIKTSRANGELFHMEETKGFIFKRTKEYSFVDEDSCTGLDMIEQLYCQEDKNE